MTGQESSVRNAARLVYKALHTSLSPANDAEYRELIALFRAEVEFRRMAEDVAIGMELQILDSSELRGLIVVPASRESRFAVRLTDIRSTGMDVPQKAALVLAHIAIAAVFFPTTDALDDDNYTAPPATMSTCRDTLFSLAKRLKDATELPADIPLDLAPGWEAICAMPEGLREAVRASPASRSGVVKLALNQMTAHGLVRLDRGQEDDASATYTATHRLRVQLRELALRRLFEMAQLTSAATA
jgi:hypothetical protein